MIGASPSQPTSEHTPTPWAIGRLKHTIVREVPDLCDSHDCYRVASADSHRLLLPSEAEANAACIVEAVNNYESLRAQLASARKALEAAKAFIVISHLAPPIHQFEREASNKHYDALIAGIDATLKDISQ